MADTDIHPSISLDTTVEQKNESRRHWAVKAAITHNIRSDPVYVGTIKTEKKTGELIGDIRWELTQAPEGVPKRAVVEIETPASNKDRVKATRRHLMFGYAVYWVFTIDAIKKRRTTENELAKQMSSYPSFGVVSLSDGELSLGNPIRWSDYDYESPWLGRNELYVPTYNRHESWMNHGDFRVRDQIVSIYRQPGQGELYISDYLENGQQTLPRRSSLQPPEFCKGVQEGDIQRETPVRGPP